MKKIDGSATLRSCSLSLHPTFGTYRLLHFRKKDEQQNISNQPGHNSRIFRDVRWVFLRYSTVCTWSGGYSYGTVRYVPCL